MSASTRKRPFKSNDDKAVEYKESDLEERDGRLNIISPLIDQTNTQNSVKMEDIDVLQRILEYFISVRRLHLILLCRQLLL